jgi:hypothetical protein
MKRMTGSPWLALAAGACLARQEFRETRLALFAPAVVTCAHRDAAKSGTNAISSVLRAAAARLFTHMFR